MILTDLKKSVLKRRSIKSNSLLALFSRSRTVVASLIAQTHSRVLQQTLASKLKISQKQSLKLSICFEPKLLSNVSTEAKIYFFKDTLKKSHSFIFSH